MAGRQKATREAKRGLWRAMASLPRGDEMRDWYKRIYREMDQDADFAPAQPARAVRVASLLAAAAFGAAAMAMMEGSGSPPAPVPAAPPPPETSAQDVRELERALENLRDRQGAILRRIRNRPVRNATPSPPPAEPTEEPAPAPPAERAPPASLAADVSDQPAEQPDPAPESGGGGPPWGPPAHANGNGPPPHAGPPPGKGPSR